MNVGIGIRLFFFFPLLKSVSVFTVPNCHLHFLGFA